MQRAMLPVHPWELLEIANEVNRSIRGNLRFVINLMFGLYARFLTRYPVLRLRTAESLSGARQGADEHAFRQLFYSICQPMIQYNFDAVRVFNMDETNFVSKHTSKAVVAVRGSSNVWMKVPTASFHISIVAAVSAGGFTIPPLFILPEKRLNKTILDGCFFPGASVIITQKGFMNANVLDVIKCLPMFFDRRDVVHG